MAKIKQIDQTKVNIDNILDINEDACMARLNCHNVGKITEFNAETQTCSIQLMQLKQFAESYYVPSLLTDVPLIIYGISDGSITLPDPTGSICLVLFLDRNIDNFLLTGEMYTPDTTRMHDFTDCVALTTFKTLVNPIQNYDKNSISINYQKLVEDVLYFSTIKNFGNSIKLTVQTDNNTSQIQVADKINIQNSSRNLATLIGDFISEVKNLKVNLTTGSITQASKDLLDDLADKFKELLE